MSFASNAGNPNCTWCPSGYEALDMGSSACTTCPVGKRGIGYGVGCTNCLPGLYRRNDDVDLLSCRKCPSGWIQSKQGRGQCIECPSGKVQPTVGRTECHDCNVNHLANVSGMLTCIACPRGYEAKGIGASICSECPEGRYGNGTTLGCVSCEVGRFRPSRDPLFYFCKNCPGKFFFMFFILWGKKRVSHLDINIFFSVFLLLVDSLIAGWRQPEMRKGGCLKCKMGKAQATNESTTCDFCLKDQYTDKAGKLYCTDCPSGYTSALGMGSTTCSTCSIGQHSSGKGLGCQYCLRGKFRKNDPYDQHFLECRACPSGFVQNKTASGFCNLCAPGLYKQYYEEFTCDECPAGWHRSEMQNSSYCLICPAGETTRVGGSATCNTCDAGEYGSSNGTCTFKTFISVTVALLFHFQYLLNSQTQFYFFICRFCMSLWILPRWERSHVLQRMCGRHVFDETPGNGRG